VWHNNSHYLYKRYGIYYYSRRIPIDIQEVYSRKKIVVSLKTKSKRIALSSSSMLTMELDKYWSSFRIKQLASNYLPNYLGNPQNLSNLTISDARDSYLALKGKTKPKLFHQIAIRNTQYIIDVLGNKDLSQYTTIDACKFRDALLNRGLVTSSVRRVFSSIKSIVSFVIKEKGLKIENPFLGVYIPDLNDTTVRMPITIEEIRIIQSKCMNIDDDLRWVISIISDTGMRLAEAIGLKSEDIILNCDIPHVIIRPNDKRRLKTKQSQRVVPLVGVSLWGAKQALKYQPNGYLFQRYNKGSISNANSASAALNKWIKPYLSDNQVIHSFRHSMRDRLRAVECPADIVDSIGGWSKSSIGENYGRGYPLEVLYKWLKKIDDA
jgi:integrase